MRIAITSSSRDEIDNIYKEEAKPIIEYLADKGYELNWGAGDKGIMAICYDEFNKRGNHIYGYTTPGYVYKLENLSNATNIVFDTTFELKKELFNDSDVIICLPGGIGTVSEILSYLEEIRSNNITKRIIICNINGWFNTFEQGIKELVDNKFADASLTSLYEIVNNVDEFKSIF